jgi:hypothetical protein
MRVAVCLAITSMLLATSCRSSAAYERGRWQTTISPVTGQLLLTDTATGRVWRYGESGDAGHWEALAPLPSSPK